jgi:hypothetical protein
LTQKYIPAQCRAMEELGYFIATLSGQAAKHYVETVKFVLL